MNFSKEVIASEVMQLAKVSEPDTDINVLQQIFNVIDLTSLNTTDNESKIKLMVEKVNDFNKHYPNSSNVAGICVYPNFTHTVKQNLKEKSVKIVAVSGGFPSSQTFLSIKLAETSLAIEKGADEIDIVMSVGDFINKNYQKVANEISLIKSICGKAHLKVILETGALPNEEAIYTASMLSMEAGADFIKTSTGKQEPAATYEAVYVMVNAIKEYYEKTGKMIGIKPAGGIVTVKQALIYHSIVKNILGDNWLNNRYFRIGASRLANNLLAHINKLKGIKAENKYF